jgi:putative FmdB family regulatory protein
MPLYEYECSACHKRTEKIQKFSDPEITECPFCSGKLERVLSAPAFSFNGGGWYADGYGNAKPKSAGDSANGSAGPKTDAGTGGNSTAAPAAAAAPSTPAPAAPAASSSSDKK